MPQINTVPLGEGGTGGAYILPQESQAANRLLDTIDYNQKIDQQNEINKQAAAQAMAKSYQDNAFKAKNGTLFNNELMALQQKHIQQGSDYAKQGIDIYNPNPNDPAQMDAHDQYMQDRGKLENLQDVRGQLQTHLLEQDKKVSEGKPGQFDPDSINALHSFYTGNTLQGIVGGGLQAPYINEAFDPESVYSKVEPVMSPETKVVRNGQEITNVSFLPKATARNVANQYATTPGGASDIQKQTGRSPQQLQQIPDTLNDITALNDQQFRNTAQGQKALVDAGITSYQDPKYAQLLQQKSQQDLVAKQKYNNIINEGVQRARAKAKIKYENVPNFAIQDEARKERDDQNQDGAVVYGNQESSVPVINQDFDKSGKVVPHIMGHAKNLDGSPDLNKPITSPSYTVPEQGATLFSQNFPQTKIMTTPGSYVDLKTGHSIKNTTPMEVNVGAVKMEPTFNNTNDNRQGAVMSKRQLMEAIQGGNLDKINFTPMVYGDKAVKNSSGKVEYQPVSLPYDAVRGNNKIKTANFDKTEQQFQETINSPEFKSLTAEQRMDFLSKTFNLK